MVPIAPIRARKNFDLVRSLSRTADQGQRCKHCCLTFWLQCSKAGYLPGLFPFLLITGAAFWLFGKWEEWWEQTPNMGRSHYPSSVRYLYFMGECDLNFHMAIQQMSGKSLVVNIQCNFGVGEWSQRWQQSWEKEKSRQRNYREQNITWKYHTGAY